MPIDHYKMSMEARPLRLLYSKYAPHANLATGSVRPLGTVRRGSAPEEDQVLSLCQLESEVSHAERVERYLAMSGEGHGLMDMYGSRKSIHSLPEGPDNGRGQGNNRSRQAFENKYKIAVSRGAQDQKVSKIYSKKVIQLPLLKINLETYVGESEDSRALESTRKSLRNILDVGRDVGRKPAGQAPNYVGGVRQANIIHYQFKTPAEIQRDALRQSIHHTSNASDRVFVAQHPPKCVDKEQVPDIRTIENKDYESSLKLESVEEEFKTTSELTGTLRDDDFEVIREEDEEEVNGEEWFGEELEGMYERENAGSSVMAHRLSSAATLGTSYRYLDFESFSSDDDVQVHHTALTSRQRPKLTGLDVRDGEFPVWPSFSDVKNLRPDLDHSSLSIKPRKREVKYFGKGSSVFMEKCTPDSLVIKNGLVPKLKIVNHHHHRPKPKRKLDPIAAPHTARECPMCNLFKVKEPTPCPPNTPRHPGDLLAEIGTPINQDSLGDVEEVEEEKEEGEETDETNRSDVVFRRRHNLLNYDLNGTPRLGPIERGTVIGEVTADYRFGFVQAKAAR